jgi:hypothetical protein
MTTRVEGNNNLGDAKGGYTHRHIRRRKGGDLGF